MIKLEYAETRLLLDDDIGAPFVKYSVRGDAYPAAAVVEVFVRFKAFEGEPSQEGLR